MKKKLERIPLLLLLATIDIFCIGCTASDITNNVFGSIREGIIAAFGDFNSDELTDVFMITNKGKTLEILLGADTEPLLRLAHKCEFNSLEITSVVPGDFDGDAFMDLMITTSTGKTENGNQLSNVFINWGGSDHLNCTKDESTPLIITQGEPVALDYNKDMIIDLFGLSKSGKRTFWIFKNDRTSPERIHMNMTDGNNNKLKVPHAHAYLDVNDDFTADLFVSTETGFEIWYGLEKEGFNYSHDVNLPVGKDIKIGQTLFLDVELKGNMNQILPICFDGQCTNSTILVYANNTYHDLQVNLNDDQTNKKWRFIAPENGQLYVNTITLRGGDFNLDGYPDLLVTLTPIDSSQPQTFFMENVPCDTACKSLSRTFKVRWRAFAPFSNGTVVGAFYDFYQDGILDVIFVEKHDEKYRPVAFRNTLDYDANFVKVIVLTGLTNIRDPTKKTPLGRKKRTYGTNLPGPRIAYYTTTQDGDIQHGSSVQIPQSAYNSLQLPYTIFGLGRTPNFVDSLTVGLSNRTRSWTQLIPNSQMIVVPWPPGEPFRWKAQLFVTPSKLILMSVIALGGTCIVIMLIILVLYIKEKREDKLEKLQEAHRFHFDAM